jgi:hypothetical protein
MVQRRAARYTCNRYHHTSSVTEMLQTLNWPTLEKRRIIIIIILLFQLRAPEAEADLEGACEACGACALLKFAKNMLYNVN